MLFVPFVNQNHLFSLLNIHQQFVNPFQFFFVMFFERQQFFFFEIVVVAPFPFDTQAFIVLILVLLEVEL